MNVCQPGSNLLCAGYCMYSSSIILVITIGKGVRSVATLLGRSGSRADLAPIAEQHLLRSRVCPPADQNRARQLRSR